MKIMTPEGQSVHRQEDSSPGREARRAQVKIDRSLIEMCKSTYIRTFHTYSFLLSSQSQSNITGHTSGISLQFRSSSLRSLSRESRDAEKPARRRSVLMNTSYSSEDLIGNVSAGRQTKDRNIECNYETMVTPETDLTFPWPERELSLTI